MDCNTFNITALKEYLHLSTRTNKGISVKYILLITCSGHFCDHPFGAITGMQTKYRQIAKFRK